ncbi:MAG: hypothetical protein ABI895_41810 [Deltaproteobacteria bacterium]
MTAPISKLPAWTQRSSDSQVILRDAGADAGLRPPEQPAAPAQSKLPTFVQGRVLAKRFLIDHVFEVTTQSTFLRAHDLRLERLVLVRLLPRSDAPTPQRARGWFRRLDPPLHSPGILATLGLGVLPGGWPLLVCQYWRGRSLEAFLRSGEAPQLLRILQLARQVALALDEAHRLGQAHGDLRADDVWLGRQADGSERAMVLGFQPRGSTETGTALVARDLDAFGDLLSLMVASLLPRYGFAANRAACADQARENGLYMVIVGPLARIAARCQRSSSEHHYVTAADVASALERVEAIAAKFSGL